MVLTIYTCEDCGEPVANWSDDRGTRPASETCPKCGGTALCKNIGQGVGTGELVSVNAGVGIGQEAQGNRDLVSNDIDAYYDRDGTLHSANRQAQNEALATRGLQNLDDGGFSTPKIRRIRERSRLGNPVRS